MGIYCDIKLFKPSDGAYTPGSIVSGTIKYCLDEETNFDKIIVSLKGTGHSQLHCPNGSGSTIFVHNETYVDIDNIVSDKEVTIPVGMYDTTFSFVLPKNIPQSFKYNKFIGSYHVSCKIVYYIRIKFDRPGFLKSAKRFKKKIEVVSGICPKLSLEPVIYGEQKILTQFLASKQNIVNIKASIENSVISTGGKIKVNYELSNNTDVTIKGVETKLIEAQKFLAIEKPRRSEVVKNQTVEDTSSKAGSVKSSETQNVEVEILVPAYINSLEHSKLVSRQYFVEITTRLPIPHRNMVLKIPVQIGDVLERNVDTANGVSVDCGEPPSYWESMVEDQEKEKESK